MAFKNYRLTCEINMDAGKHKSVVVRAKTERAAIKAATKLVEKDPSVFFFIPNFKIEILE